MFPYPMAEPELETSLLKPTQGTLHSDSGFPSLRGCGTFLPYLSCLAYPTCSDIRRHTEAVGTRGQAHHNLFSGNPLLLESS